MFLNRLNENEKMAFLELAHYVAISDGEIANEEKKIIKLYAKEMDIKDIEFNEKEFDFIMA